MTEGARILVVGAGPTGLTLAYFLRKFGVNVDLIDKREGVAKDSKALAVNMLNQMCFDALVGRRAIGLRAEHLTRLNVVADGTRLSAVDFRHLRDPHRYVLSQPQWQTELELRQLLREVDGAVEEGTELLGLLQNSSAAFATIRHGTRTETRRYDFVVGCDGGRSTVREQVGIGFTRRSYEQYLVLADYQLQTTMKRGQAHYVVDGERFFVFVALPEDRWRVVGMFAGTSPGGESSQAQLRLALRDVFGEEFLRGAPTWTSHAQLCLALAERVRDGRVFLAGDAAHLYSPLGGTGMNTGMQDAMNLAWKLSWCVRSGKTHEALLSSYAVERQTVHRQNGQETDLLMKLAVERDEAALAPFLPRMKNRHAWRTVVPMLRGGLLQRYDDVFPQIPSSCPESTSTTRQKCHPSPLGTVWPFLGQARRALSAQYEDYALDDLIVVVGRGFSVSDSRLADSGFGGRPKVWWLAAAQKTPSALEARTVVLNDTAPELACTGALLIRPDGVVGAHVPVADAKSLRECIDALIKPLNPSPHLQSAELSA